MGALNCLGKILKLSFFERERSPETKQMFPDWHPKAMKLFFSSTANDVIISSSTFSNSLKLRMQRGTPFSSSLSINQSFSVAFLVGKESSKAALMWRSSSIHLYSSFDWKFLRKRPPSVRETSLASFSLASRPSPIVSKIFDDLYYPWGRTSELYLIGMIHDGIMCNEATQRKFLIW